MSESFEFQNLRISLGKKRLLVIAVIVLFLSVVVIQVNYNRNHMANYTVDEYFTISTVHPKFEPSNTVFRALNGPRLFTYVFYPGALVGMIGHMGGDVYLEGWDYPGHNYFVNNYQTSGLGLKENMEDPNLRYFHYYLKLQVIFFMFLSFLPLIYWLWHKGYVFALFMLASLVGINFLVLEERSLYYIEPLLLSMMNLLLWYFLYIFDQKKVSWFLLSLGAFLFALTLSLKFSCLFLVLIITVFLVHKFQGLEDRLKAASLLLLMSVVFFCAINWPIFAGKEVFGKILHDYFSNFYQYATGNKGDVGEHFQRLNLRRMLGELLTSLGGLLWLFPLLAIWGIGSMKPNERLRWGALLLTLLISIWAIAKQRVYIDRNIMPFIPWIVLLTGVFLDSIRKYLLKKPWFKVQKNQWISATLLLLIFFVPIGLFSKDYVYTVLPSAKRNGMEKITNIRNGFYDRLVVCGTDLSEFPKNFERVFELNNFPETNANTLPEELSKYSAIFKTSDVVWINEEGNNKQLTNYLLPKLFNTNTQFGDYFIFYNDPSANQDYLEFLNISKEKTGAQSHFEGSIRFRQDLLLTQVISMSDEEVTRVYLRFDTLESTPNSLEGCRMSLHGYPADGIAALPESRKEFGFENWDFTISSSQLIRFGKEIILYTDLNPSTHRYESVKFRIFRGCNESEEIILENIEF